MKNKLWYLQILIVLIATSLFVITELGSEGALSNHYLHDQIFPKLRAFSGLMTNLKFKLRGSIPPKNKIVIVEIDGDAIEQLGRWPWHRDMTAKLIESVFTAGAQVVGLDIAFSEPDQRISPEMAGILKSRDMGYLVDMMETDPVLATTIQKYSDRLVLGWFSEADCSPRYTNQEMNCPVFNPYAVASLPPEEKIAKFQFQYFGRPDEFQPQNSALRSAPVANMNIPLFTDPAQHSGFFNSQPDSDGFIRRSSLLMMVDGKPYPSLPLEMARVGLREKLRIDLSSEGLVSSMKWAESNRAINVNPMGVMEVNFRGPGRTFSYVPALEVLKAIDQKKDPGRTLASSGTDVLGLLKDAYVFIGLTAVGVFDMRAFPFDSNVAGVEGHANILDNLLSDDALSSGTSGGKWGFYIMIFMMTLGALAFAHGIQTLEAFQGLLLFVLVFTGLGVVDTELLFRNGINWNTSFFIVELGLMFVMTVAVKYVIEEQNKKFIKSAFSKYVAPSIVDSILKDPSKLSLGGEKRDMTVLFSDIRGFTSISEKMDAKSLSSFLNDYLGIMTRIVFEHEGTLDKYIGDAVMAFWGAPLDQPKHALNSTLAALDMMKALGENKERFKTQYGVDVDIGIGINSGVVSVGNMGSESNFEYTVIGDHVNLASRLEGITKLYRVPVITSRFTLEHIRELGLPLPAHRTLDFVKAKGKENAVELIHLSETALDEKGLSHFEEGRRFYAARDWDSAIEQFRQAITAFGGDDGPSTMFIERCESFRANPPEPDWDGTWKMRSK